MNKYVLKMSSYGNYRRSRIKSSATREPYKPKVSRRCERSHRTPTLLSPVAKEVNDMSETLWISPSGMMHKSNDFSYLTKCNRTINPLSLRNMRLKRSNGWRRALVGQELDASIPKCSQCDKK